MILITRLTSDSIALNTNPEVLHRYQPCRTVLVPADKYPSPECLRAGLYQDSIQVNMASFASVLFFQERLSISSHSTLPIEGCTPISLHRLLNSTLVY
jgi:hypothetical protein